MPDYSGERSHTSDEQPVSVPPNRRKQPSQQPRQLLSCTKCRERKVKCDRTKPCSACCARGQPKDCHFIAEGGDYAPIQQSYELRKLRAENLRLKERLRASKIPIEDEESDFATSPDSHLADRSGSSQRRRTAKQKRFQGSEWQDSIYFGSPGLASVVTDFATMNIRPMSSSLAYLMPRGQDMYTPKSPPPYPFPTFFPATPEECIPELLNCLPQREELFECLNAFEKRVHVCSFPHVPLEITKSEVERFLDDARRNAQMCPDMLALIFAAIALGGQHSVWDRSGGQWGVDTMHFEINKGNIYIAAAKQALRLASFMHKPSLLGIQALLMIGPYLTNSGRFLDAWTLFGTTIRLAHSIGLHRHPKKLDPAPPTQRECSIRQTLWWWMLHMDEQYSMTLGRPLGISGLGDCPPPHELTTDPRMLRFSEFINYFTILARQILSSECLTNAKVDEFTDSLKGLLDTMPEMLQFDSTWLLQETEIPEWPLSAMAAVYHCKAHTYLILLNRQRLDKYAPQAYSSTIKATAPAFRSVNRTPPSQSPPTTATNVSLRGRTLVLTSSEEVLDAFLFFYLRVPAALISWTMAQQAFNASMILLLDAMERMSVTSGAVKAEKAFVVFQELQNIHSLASLAVERISWGLAKLHEVTQMPSGHPGTREAQGCESEVARVWNEAINAPHAMYEDSVMNATGMFLLEDPGLQGFVPEAFAPIAWNLGGVEPPEPFQLKREGQVSPGGGPMDSPESDEDTEDARSVGGMQGLRRSTTMRSAHTRYATPTLDDHQPHRVTAPTLHTNSTRQMQQHHVSQISLPDASHRHARPPHSQQPQIFEENNNGYNHPIVASTIDERQPQYEGNLLDLQQAPIAQMRHNSCPSLHLPASAPLPARPTYSSPATSRAHPPIAKAGPAPGLPGISDQASFQDFLESIPQSISPNSSPEGQASWAVRIADRSVNYQIQDPSMHELLPFQVGQALSGFPQTMAHDRQSASAYDMHFSEAPMNAPLGTEISVDDWKRWMSSSLPE
ncbi:hypothetical protein HBI23_032060 [Parastagonospora nodorum]|nr:hypothetical protein HBI23_032060 [Parastagonospora nodorum]KAH6059812.1 hypothetical protein HBI66_203810 [Parastagonospora nodorum]